MRRLPPRLFFCAPALLVAALTTSAQVRGPLPLPSNPRSSSDASSQTSPKPPLLVPTGTKITVAVTKPVWARTAKPGDTIYGVTAFPTVVADQMAVPPGTYVEGVIDSLTRPGHSGHAAFQLHFTELIFANGYFVPLDTAASGQPASKLPASASSAPSAISGDLVQQAYLAELGGLSGAPSAMLYVNVSSSSDVLLDNGTQFDMIVQTPLQLDAARIANALSVSKAPLLTQFKSATQCRFIPGTPAIPGTPDTVIPGTPGTPPTVIPGIDGAPPTVIPGTPATPPTVIPGTPGTPGIPDRTCPGPPIVTAPPVDLALHSKSFPVTDPLFLNGRQLIKGSYKATWTGSGPNVQVLITRKNTPDISVPAHLVTLQTKAAKNLLTPRTDAGGSPSLQSVQFKGQTFALYFDPPAASDSAAGSAAPPGNS